MLAFFAQDYCREEGEVFMSDGAIAGPHPALRLRSPLFAPGDSARKAAKALASEADAVILDLEDSVAAAGKEAARAEVAAMLPGISRPGVIVRINPPGHALVSG